MFACIRVLLGDASRLKERYGLTEAPAQGFLDEGQTLYARDSAPLMEKFVCDFAAFQIRAWQERPSVGARFKWVIRDKDKFQSLLTELAYFISNLKEMVPALSCNPAERRTNLKRPNDSEDDNHSAYFKRVRLPGGTQPLNDTLVGKILQCIRFHCMDDRRLNVSTAHDSTFEWALRPSNGPTHCWSDLVQWLSCGSGVYWVHGKAGCGKSTLMRYLYDHATTNRLLSQWAGSETLLVGSHFFWNLGKPEQKTQQGLQRSIIYQILSHKRSMISEALPRIYADALTAQHDVEQRLALGPPPVVDLYSAIGLEPLSAAEIDYAFRVFEQASGLGRICLFIDGMDEFEGR